VGNLSIGWNNQNMDPARGRPTLASTERTVRPSTQR